MRFRTAHPTSGKIAALLDRDLAPYTARRTGPVGRPQTLPNNSTVLRGPDNGQRSQRVLRRYIDSNGPMIAAFAAMLGLEVQRIGCASDDAESIDTMLSLVASSMGDIVISTGGVSGGSHDLIRSRIEEAGARIGFHGVRMRPGKPMLFATFSDGRPFFGLPGNPVAAFICLRLFVHSALRVLAGLPHEVGVAVSGEQLHRLGTTVFLRGRAISHAGSISQVDTSCDQRSHVLSSLLRSDTLLRVDGESDTGPRLTAYPKIPELL